MKRAMIALTIEIPNVVLIPTREVSFGYREFDLENLERIAYRPVSEELLVQQLRDRERELIGWTRGSLREARLDDYLVAVLVERDEIDYEAHAALLYELSGQVVARLRAYLADYAEVENVLVYYRRQLGEFVWAQLEQHAWETPTDYQGRVIRGFTLLRALPFPLPAGQSPRNFRQPLEAGVNIRQVVFTGFHKCCYSLQQFHSAEGELRLAIVLEDDPTCCAG
jgi:type III restriction enzyme